MKINLKKPKHAAATRQFVYVSVSLCRFNASPIQPSLRPHDFYSTRPTPSRYAPLCRSSPNWCSNVRCAPRPGNCCFCIPRRDEGPRHPVIFYHSSLMPERCGTPGPRWRVLGRDFLVRGWRLLPCGIKVRDQLVQEVQDEGAPFRLGHALLDFGPVMMTVRLR